MAQASSWLVKPAHEYLILNSRSALQGQVGTAAQETPAGPAGSARETDVPMEGAGGSAKKGAAAFDALPTSHAHKANGKECGSLASALAGSKRKAGEAMGAVDQAREHGEQMGRMDGVDEEGWEMAITWLAAEARPGTQHTTEQWGGQAGPRGGQAGPRGGPTHDKRPGTQHTTEQWKRNEEKRKSNG